MIRIHYSNLLSLFFYSLLQCYDIEKEAYRREKNDKEGENMTDNHIKGDSKFI